MISLLTVAYLREYARRPLNLVLLAIVPTIFVAFSGNALADFARILGGSAEMELLKTVTAGWAAAFLAGVAGFFHVTGSRNADRRTARAGAGSGRVVIARLASGLVLALLGVAGALLALFIFVGSTDLVRSVGGTVMFAGIYLGLGAAVGAVVRSEVNGSLVVVFVWLFDLFLGPAMGGTDRLITRFFPTHFPTLVMLDQPTDHAPFLQDMGASLFWLVGSLGLATVLLWRSTRPSRISGGSRSTSERGTPAAGRGLPDRWVRLFTGLRYAFVDYRRNPALWVLLVFIPIGFITLSFYVTPATPTPVEVVEQGRSTVEMISMVDVHGAIMVPITVAFLSGLAGLFVVLGSADGDRRLVLAGFRTGEVLFARIGVVAFAALLTTGVSLAVTAVDFSPESWAPFAGANVLVALTYGLLGVVVGPLVGRLGGLYLMFLVPFLDPGLGQNVMFSAAPPAWGRYLPAHGATRVLLDGAFSPSFDEVGGLLLAFAWLFGVGGLAVWVFRRQAEPSRT